MFDAIMLAFAGALLVGNGLPHFIQGITRKPYPSILGDSPVINLLAGWANFMFGGYMLRLVDFRENTVAPLCAASLGLLAAGLFHASIGSIGRKREM